MGGQENAADRLDLLNGVRRRAGMIRSFKELIIVPVVPHRKDLSVLIYGQIVQKGDPHALVDVSGQQLLVLSDLFGPGPP